MDKVQKIREEVAKKLEVMQYQVHRKDAYKELKGVLAYIDSLQEEPVSEDLNKVAIAYNKKVNFVVAGNIPNEHFIAGAKWQKANLWKPADGDDLPEYEREVIALEGIIDPTANDCFCGYKVVFAHRPTPEGYDGKSIATGEVEHYTPKTYDKGGWNIPDVKYWLDVELPKEIEL